MIDWPRVRELKDEVGEDGFEEVIELFLEEVEGVIDKLKSGDRSQLEQDLHFLKGSALNLGFRDFSNLCFEGERLAANGQDSTIDLPGVFSSYDLSKARFLAEVDQQA
ncbi:MULTISPECIES: Hpt domain-containing protein [unclassified Epibacterium]|uniref:Hpt domain-containing protein n=1 Tax=unclassified Epibacterium TaxID=2639179 RepID=UPI001EF5793A|nr:MULTISPECIES: Hpt domain-containing protein [unclassified Epibacterium]MCG7623778.1 Hpt domain-containing protein [Epibacterium sp. Ofav1-8]MCG7628309.1 Hpt domain-containing protein [Epibacterium sp. MM17-32]